MSSPRADFSIWFCHRHLHKGKPAVKPCGSLIGLAAEEGGRTSGCGSKLSWKLERVPVKTRYSLPLPSKRCQMWQCSGGGGQEIGASPFGWSSALSNAIIYTKLFSILVFIEVSIFRVKQCSETD